MANTELFERAREQFRARRENLHRVEVPEWGDEDGPFVLHIRPATLRELDAAEKYTGQRRLIELIIRQARDPQGEALFARAMAETMMDEFDPQVIDRIGVELLKVNFEAADTDGAKKNSKHNRS